MAKGRPAALPRAADRPQVETSTLEAVKWTELKGKVEVNEKGEVAPPAKPVNRESPRGPVVQLA
jgi:hypothetical protein